MPGPAARIGDQTAHGGAIIKGEFMVLIGGKPAARVTDMQSCPVVQGTVAHGSTPILPPGQTMVLIGGLPAATMGDTCAPPCGASIISGDMTVLIGTSPGGVGPAVGIAAPGVQAAAPGVNPTSAGRSSDSSVAEADAAERSSSTVDQEEQKEQEKQETTWLEIELLDEDGEPAAHEKYKVIDSAEKEKTGTLDGNGYTKVEGLKPGSCKVIFSELNEDAWGRNTDTEESDASGEREES